MQILQHFTGRMEEMAGVDGKNKELANYHKELQEVRDRLDALLHADSRK